MKVYQILFTGIVLICCLLHQTNSTGRLSNLTENPIFNMVVKVFNQLSRIFVEQKVILMNTFFHNKLKTPVMVVNRPLNTSGSYKQVAQCQTIRRVFRKQMEFLITGFR